MTRQEALERRDWVLYNLGGERDKEAANLAFAALKGEWTPVTEALPTPFLSVLGYEPTQAPLPTVHECYVDKDGNWHSAAVYGMRNVTHWARMPEEPDET